MNKLLNGWQTTLFGALAAVCSFLSKQPQLAEYQQILSGLESIFLVLVGMFAITAKHQSTYQPSQTEINNKEGEQK